MPNTKLSNIATKGTTIHPENGKKLRHSTGGNNASSKVSTIEPSSIRCDNNSSNMTSTSQYSRSEVVPDSKDARNHEEVMISDLQTNLNAGLTVLPPERPPKPAHLIITNQKNSDSSDGSVSKQRYYPHSSENYANADDMQALYISEQNNNINSDLHHPESSQEFGRTNEAATLPKNVELSNGEFYQAPAVSRDLKPNRRNITARHRSQTIGGNMIAAHMSSYATSTMNNPTGKYEGSLSNVSEANSISNNFKTLGPPVVRALKPHNSDSHEGRSRFNSVDFAALNHRKQITENDEDNSRRNSVEEEQIYYYMPPVNTTSGLGGVHSSKPPPLMIPAASFEHPSISYIDLDLPKTTSPTSKQTPIGKISEGSHVMSNHYFSDKQDGR